MFSSHPLTKDSVSKTVEIMPDGSRMVSLSPHMMESPESQRELFREKFGREPGPNDPIFFDPNADKPREMPLLDPAALESVAVQAGVRPEIAFAMAKTGVFLIKENEHLSLTRTRRTSGRRSRSIGRGQAVMMHESRRRGHQDRAAIPSEEIEAGVEVGHPRVTLGPSSCERYRGPRRAASRGIGLSPCALAAGLAPHFPRFL